MSPLRLSPLPTTRADEDSPALAFERDAPVYPPAASRKVPFPADLALSADDLDFAGWALPPRRSAARAEVPRRPAPPVIAEPGLGSPHAGSHRWWMAGLAGILSSSLFSILLLHLSAKPGNTIEAFNLPHAKAAAAPLPAAAPVPAKSAPELTDISAPGPVRPQHVR